MTLGRTLISIPASVVSWPLSALRGLPLLSRTISTTSRVPILWPALRTAGLSLVALALFGGLFASGDAVFGTWTTATFLTLVVVALTMRLAARTTSGDRILLRVLLGMLCLLTLAVVASALYRMGLYQQAYGYTVLLLFVDGFELWLGLVVVLLLIAGIQLSGQWLARAIFISAAVFTLTFAAINPDSWVAQHKIERFESGRSLDPLSLSTLSADATPTLVDRLPTEVTRCMFGLRDYASLRDDALAWNLGRDRAQAALESPEVLGPIADPADCDQVITDDCRGSGSAVQPGVQSVRPGVSERRVTIEIVSLVADL